MQKAYADSIVTRELGDGGDSGPGRWRVDANTQALQGFVKTEVNVAKNDDFESGTDPDSWMESTGEWSSTQSYVVMKVKPDGGLQLKRPHINATTLQIKIQARVRFGTFSTAASVELMDNAEYGFKADTPYNRTVTAAQSFTPTSDWGTTTITLDSALLRGHEDTSPRGGIRDFNDLAIKVNAPKTGSNPGVTKFEVGHIELNVEDSEPGELTTAHWGVRPPNASAGGNWVSVDYATGTEYTTMMETGQAINSGKRALIDACRRVGSLNGAWTAQSSGDAIVEIEDLTNPGTGPNAYKINGNFQIGGVANSGDSRAWWRDASGGIRMIDGLIVRSLNRGGDDRAEINNTSSPPSCNVTGPDLGHVSFAGLRFFNEQPGPDRCFSNTFDQNSTNFLLGFYDCHFCGDTGKGGIDSEMRMGLRSGYHGVDFHDCKCGPTWEHFFYWGGVQRDSQILRCETDNSINFYPSHPNPSTLYPKGFTANTFHQIATRTNACDSSGEGPPAPDGTTLLVEDCVCYNRTTGGGTFTITSGMFNYINRRCAQFNLNTSKGRPFHIWNTVGTHSGGGLGQAFGHHTSVGQMDGDEGGSHVGHCQSANLANPEYYPESGSCYTHGDVLIEEFSGSDNGSNDGYPIQTSGCKSLTLRNVAMSNYQRLPTIYDLLLHNGNWLSTTSTAGPYATLKVTFEGDNVFRNANSIIAFGDTENPLNNGGGAGFIASATLTLAQAQALIGDNDAWPPWPQTNDFGSISGGYEAGRLYPGVKPPTTYGGSKSTITYPGRNTFIGLEMVLTPTAPTVGGASSPPTSIVGQIMDGSAAATTEGDIIGLTVGAMAGTAAGVATSFGNLGKAINASAAGTATTSGSISDNGISLDVTGPGTSALSQGQSSQATLNSAGSRDGAFTHG